MSQGLNTAVTVGVEELMIRWIGERREPDSHALTRQTNLHDQNVGKMNCA